MKITNATKAVLLSIVAGAAFAQDSGIRRLAAPEGANAYIISPADGEKVSAPFQVRFGLQGAGVAPAGTMVANTGHHHLLIDVEEMPSFALPLPASENVVHFGGGQTETTLDLSPGEHTLQLVLGDGSHVPHNPAIMSTKITITVVGD